MISKIILPLILFLLITTFNKRYNEKKSEKENFKINPNQVDYLKDYMTLINKSEKKCKYLPVLNKNQSCPNEYPIYDGHVFKNTTKEFCSMKKNPNCAMKVFVKNSKVLKVKVLSSDTGFITNLPPTIKINSNGGRGVRCKPVIYNKKLVKVMVLDGGVGYDDESSITLKHNTGDNYCKLCCNA